MHTLPLILNRPPRLDTTSIFRPHGRFHVRAEGQLLLTDVTGPWNRELIEHWAQQARQIAIGFSPDRPYIGVTTVHESILCPADALNRIQRALEYSKTNLSCLANIIIAADDVEGRDLVIDKYQRIGLDGFFADATSATAWAFNKLREYQSNSRAS
ncbi:hypothetical protein [Undibacterium fentianense]|uniref:Uncharacterized protein n=1 Tax=Undibacterium fentianense TaxID=2828728 RepID=A0A941IFX4_9BURK|nr:hypothetical protein [Undibacterium fentianense]MBR7799455.1 hypothetical protein [Undibacterium fentianense]